MMRYNHDIIKELIDKALTANDFKDLLFYHFRDVNDSTEGQSRPDQTRELIDYAEKQGEFPKLFEEIKKLNSTRFKEFEDRLINSPEPKTAGNGQAIARLEKEKEMLFNQWAKESIDKNKADIFEMIVQKENEINLIKHQSSRSCIANFRTDWENKLIEIDFTKSKNLIEKFRKDCLNRSDRRYALLLLDNAIAMEGELMMRWLENYLRACGNWSTPFIHCFTTTATKEDFISALAMQYKMPKDIELSEFTKKLRSKFWAGEIFMIKIEMPTGNASEFLLWFVEEFWQQFTEELDDSFAVVAAISIDCQFKSESLPDSVFCQSKFNGQKIKRLPLQNWTQDDVKFWLRDHSGLGKRGSNMEDFEELANSVWNVDKGKPNSTRDALLKNLERRLTQAMQVEERA